MKWAWAIQNWLFQGCQHKADNISLPGLPEITYITLNKVNACMQTCEGQHDPVFFSTDEYIITVLASSLDLDQSSYRIIGKNLDCFDDLFSLLIFLE